MATPAPSVTDRFALDGRYAWTRLAISLAISTIGGVGMWAVVVVLPQVQAEFGADRAGASIPYTMTMLGFALGNVVIGRFIDRVGFMLPALVSTVDAGGGLHARLAERIGDAVRRRAGPAHRRRLVRAPSAR